MSGYGNSLVSGNSTFTYAEKNEIGFKSSLGRIMTDLKRNWNEEPVSKIIRDPITVLKKKIPSYEKIKHYYLIDPMIGENSNGPMVTNVTVETAINSWASSKLDTILDTNIIRDNDDLHWQLSVELNNTAQNKNFYQLNKLSRNMFAKHVYWKKGLTGALTNDVHYVPNGPTNEPIQYITTNSNGINNTGSYPSTTSPFNSFLNLTSGNNPNNSFNHGPPSQFRTYSQIMAGVKLKEEAKERGDEIYENHSSRLYTFLKTAYTSIDIIAPNDRHDITKKHPYIKFNLCVPTIPTWDPTIVNEDNSSNIINDPISQINYDSTTLSSLASDPFIFVIVYDEDNNYYEDQKNKANLDKYFSDLKSGKPQIFGLYWSKTQIEIRQSERMAKVKSWLNHLWDYTFDDVNIFDPDRELVYADRVRRREAGDSSLGLSPHCDAGSVERWIDAAFQKIYEPIFNGNFKNYNPFSAKYRDQTKEIESPAVSHVFRTFQGWTALTKQGPSDGTLQLIPIAKSMAYILTRALLDDVPDSELCGSLPARALSVNEKYHSLLLKALVSIPTVNPGDTVWWHPDVVHGVEEKHKGKNYSNVVYVGSTPYCKKNLNYAKKQAEKFLLGKSPPDFASEDYEVKYLGRATVEDLSVLGKKQMAILEWN